MEILQKAYAHEGGLFVCSNCGTEFQASRGEIVCYEVRDEKHIFATCPICNLPVSGVRLEKVEKA